MLVNGRLTAALLAILLPMQAAAVPQASPIGPLSQCSDIGIYRLLTAPRRAPAAATSAGYSSVVRADLMHPTLDIPLELGQVFGFRFSIADRNASAEWLPVEFEVHHPPIVDHRGRPRRVSTIRTAAQRGADGRYSNRALYILSEARELVDGDWQLRVRYRGNTICQAHFQVIAR